MRADRFHAFINCDRFQGGTVLKSTRADLFDIRADHDLLEITVAGKGAFSDHSDVFGNDKGTVCICLSYAGYQNATVECVIFLRFVARVGGRGVFGLSIVVARSKASESYTYAQTKSDDFFHSR